MVCITLAVVLLLIVIAASVAAGVCISAGLGLVTGATLLAASRWRERK